MLHILKYSLTVEVYSRAQVKIQRMNDSHKISVDNFYVQEEEKKKNVDILVDARDHFRNV